MAIWRRLESWLSWLPWYRRRAREADLERELRDHLDLEADEQRDAGLSPDEAANAAHRALGNTLKIEEDVRAAWRFQWLETVAQDLRYGLRMLRKSPATTALVVLILGLGVGANTAIFSLVNAVMLESLPVSHPEQLVVPMWMAHHSPISYNLDSHEDCPLAPKAAKDSQDCSFSYPMLQELRARTDLFSSVAGFSGPVSLDVSGNGPATLANGDLVSGDYFQALGVRLAIGRVLEPADDRPGAAPVTVLNYAYWQSTFGGAPSAVGRTIHLNGIVFEIAGVADPRFTRLTPGSRLDLWVPLAQAKALRVHRTDPTAANAGRDWWLTLVARLSPAVPRERAEAALDVIYHNETMAIPEPLFKSEDDPRISLLPAQQQLTGFRSRLGDPLTLLMAAVGIVLLITCANVAGLMLARSTVRQREMAVRLALGAGRGRIVRQLLTESILLSVLGSALGILVAIWSARALAAFFAANSYSAMHVDLHPDFRVLAFTIAVALLAGIGFGLAPAILGSRFNLTPALRENPGSSLTGLRGRGRRFGLGSALVLAQVALSVVMLIGAGLLVRTLVNLRAVPIGFDPDNLVIFTMSPSLAGYKQPAVSQLYEQLSAKFAALPGVSAVTYSSQPLLDDQDWGTGVHIEGTPADEHTSVNALAIGPGYFSTMRIALLRGRTLTLVDMDSMHHVAVVNEAFARKIPGGRSPLGLHLGEGKDAIEIVGVVADAKYDDIRKATGATVYFVQNDGGTTFALRATASTAELMESVRRVVYEIAPDLPVVLMRTESDAIDRLLFNERLMARLSFLFGVLALVLTCLGLYGLLAYEVARGTREIGIRMALGAQTCDMLRGILLRGAALVLVGAAVGMLVAVGVTRFIQSLLYGVKPVDALTFACVAALLLIVAIAACWIPARRAMRVDPMVTLRYE